MAVDAVVRPFSPPTSMDEGRRPPTPTSASLSPPRADMAHSAEVQAPRSVEEIVRSDLDVRTHAVTDALYRLASHVALDLSLIHI